MVEFNGIDLPYDGDDTDEARQEFLDMLSTSGIQSIPWPLTCPGCEDILKIGMPVDNYYCGDRPLGERSDLTCDAIIVEW